MSDEYQRWVWSGTVNRLRVIFCSEAFEPGDEIAKLKAKQKMGKDFLWKYGTYMKSQPKIITRRWPDYCTQPGKSDE